MSELKQLRALMESIQLNEYLVTQGEPINAVTQLNLFGDAEERPSEHEAEFRSSSDWMEVENTYYGIASKLEAMLASSPIILSDQDVDDIHSVWYDGSDSYSDVETALENLPDIYDAQIELVQNLLRGGEQEVEEDAGYNNY